MAEELNMESAQIELKMSTNMICYTTMDKSNKSSSKEKAKEFETNTNL